MPNLRVFFDITIGDKPAGPIVMELFADTAPLTAENFRAICTNEKGIGSDGKPIHYKGSAFLIVKPGEYCIGGSISCDKDFQKGEGIYGKQYNYEKLINKHTGPRILSMSSENPNTDKSGFLIYLKEKRERDGRYVVFGQVVKGLEVIKSMGKVSSRFGANPLEAVDIAECGQLQVRMVEQVISNSRERLDILKRIRKDLEQLNVKNVEDALIVDMEKVKDVVDMKHEIEDLVKLENIVKQHVGHL